MKCLDQDSRILPPFSPSLVFRGRRMLWQHRRQPGLFTLSWPLRASTDKARHVKSLKTKTNSNDINVLFSCISKSALSNKSPFPLSRYAFKRQGSIFHFSPFKNRHAQQITIINIIIYSKWVK